MNPPDNLTKLPESGVFILKTDTRVDGSDLQRFVDRGGSIRAEGYKLYIDGPTPIGGDQTVLEETPHGRETTIFGQTLTVPPNTTVIGAHPDGNGGSGFGVRLVTHGSPLAAGTVVYRVIEDDPPEGQHTWKVAARVVERASSKQIKLKVNFTGLSRTLFDPSAFGRLFFETPRQAIQAFLIERRLEAESLERRRKEADRAIAWAESQEGVQP